MNDRETSLQELKEAVRQLCRDKGWGADRDGEQNPQQVAMAMTVEMSELLENFQWLGPEEVEDVWDGRDTARIERIAGEFADIMMYGLQLTMTLGIDISSEIEKKIAHVRRRDNDYYEKKRRMRDEFEQEATAAKRLIE